MGKYSVLINRVMNVRSYLVASEQTDEPTAQESTEATNQNPENSEQNPENPEQNPENPEQNPENPEQNPENPTEDAEADILKAPIVKQEPEDPRAQKKRALTEYLKENYNF